MYGNVAVTALFRLRLIGLDDVRLSYNSLLHLRSFAGRLWLEYTFLSMLQISSLS